PFLLVVTVIVTIHELGHFLTAKAFGVAIDRFSIGFGRPIAMRRDRSGVEWRIGWLPLGGYVKFAGDGNAAGVPDGTDLAAARARIVAQEGAGAEAKYMPFKPLWQRALIVAAGPGANFVLAAALFSFFFGAFGEPVTSTRVDEVVPGGAAAAAGFQAGDTVLTADGRPMASFQDLQYYVQYRAGTPIDFGVRRGGTVLHMTARPTLARESSPFGGRQDVGRLGLAARGGELRRFGPLQAVRAGVSKTWEVTATTVFYLGRIVTGKVGADQLHSFVGIAHASGSMTKDAVAAAHDARISWLVAAAYFLIQLAALMSVSVGILNLLPIPVLDGGHLLFYAYESIARRPVGARAQAAGYRVGLALLVGLMLFATWNDLQQLRVFRFLGSLFS
ncbi:MAG: M50 family metallopeptidase, partial [Caulobacteraceae bacterium]